MLILDESSARRPGNVYYVYRPAIDMQRRADEGIHALDHLIDHYRDSQAVNLRVSS